MARSFNRFLTKSWTDFPIEGSSPLLNQKISAFLLFNPFSTRCPNNSQPKVSLFYFLIFWRIFYGRCLNPLSVVAHFGCWPNEKFCNVSRMQLDFDSKKKKKIVPTYQVCSVLFLRISLFHMLYKHLHDTLWRYKDNILLWPNLWQGPLTRRCLQWRPVLLILNWVSLFDSFFPLDGITILVCYSILGIWYDIIWIWRNPINFFFSLKKKR